MNQNQLTAALAQMFVSQVSPPALRNRPPSPQGQPLSFEWGVVTAVGPVAIQMDGETAPLGYTPDSIIPLGALGVGDRVWCLNYGTFVLVLGVGGGVVSTGWQALPYAAGFADYGGAYRPGQFRLSSDGWVRVRGLAQATGSNASGATLATLPAGFRPGAQELFTQQATPAPAIETVVYPDGTIKIFTATTAGQYVTLSGIAFQIDGV